MRISKKSLWDLRVHKPTRSHCSCHSLCVGEIGDEVEEGVDEAGMEDASEVGSAEAESEVTMEASVDKGAFVNKGASVEKAVGGARSVAQA